MLDLRPWATVWLPSNSGNKLQQMYVASQNKKYNICQFLFSVMFDEFRKNS